MVHHIHICELIKRYFIFFFVFYLSPLTCYRCWLKTYLQTKFGGGEMVFATKAHNSNNCLVLNNSNRIGSGNVVAISNNKSTSSKSNNTNIRSRSNRKNVYAHDCYDNNTKKSQIDCRWLQRTRCKQQVNTEVEQKRIINDNTVTVKKYNLHHRHIDIECYHHGNSNRSNSNNNGRNAILANIGKCNLSSSILYCAAILFLVLHIDVIAAQKPQQSALKEKKIVVEPSQAPPPPPSPQCESKVLDEIPPDPVNIYLHTKYSQFLFFPSFS